MARTLINVPEEERPHDVIVGGLVNKGFCAISHVDIDALPTSIGPYDLGGCGKCHLEQWLCFPTLGLRVPIRNRRVVTFDPTIPHCASFIHIVRYGDCKCSPMRFGVVPFSKAKYFGDCKLRYVVIPASSTPRRVEHKNENSARKIRRQ